MFKRPPPKPPRQMDDYTPRPRAAAVAVAVAGPARAVISLPKREYVRDEKYLRAVAALPCAHCGKAGPSQAAHSDYGGAGKGMGIKSDDSSAWPACADSPGRVGCHTLLGATGMFTREQRRHLEKTYAERTRQQLKDTTR
jgi:hypothetical protein